MMFVDKARLFERMLEGLLKETFELMLLNFDIEDYVEIFGESAEADALAVLAQQTALSRGEFVAVGARHWTRRNRETLEMNNFMTGPMKDPKVRAHVDGSKLASFWERKLNIEDEGIVEDYAGIKEDVRLQAIAQEEAKRLQEVSQGQPVGVGDVSGTGVETFTEEGGQGDSAGPGEGQSTPPGIPAGLPI